jgi:hypothetical protein
MSSTLILFVGVIYVAIGVDLCIKTQYGLGISFLAYALANVGLYLAARGI